MEKPQSMGDQFLSTINQIIEDNLDNENFSVEDLAKNAGLSRSMLHRKLIRLIGKSATDYIAEIRIIRAKELLENDVATASEIAYRVGFKSPSYFNKVFKKYFNVSPGDVRKGVVVEMERLFIGQKREKHVYSSPKFYKLTPKFLIILVAIVVAGIVVYFFLTRYRPAEKSIAVLPIQNLTGQPDNSYFIDGMQDALIGELGQIGSLRVISRTSTLRYRDSDMLLKDIAHELGVNNIVEGSVYCAGDSICFSIQLIDVFPKERHILANEYYDEMQNILAVHTSAVKDIAQKINIKLSKNIEQRLAESRTVDPETYKAYLRGMYYLNQGTKEAFEKGINYLQEAIDRDPGDPFAYAALALGYATMGHGQLTPKAAFLCATSAANKAIKLDPNIDEAYTALAMLYLYDAWDWPLAKEAFENAIARNPSNAIAHAHFAWYHILFNDMEKSIYHAKQAVLIEPFLPSYNAWLSLLCYHNKDYAEAEYWAKKALALYENAAYGNITLGWICLHKKQYQQAIEYCEKLPDYDYYWKMMRGYIYVKAGQREKALDYYNEMVEYSKNHWVNKGEMGMMAAYLGFTDKAFEMLNDALEQKLYPLIFINFYPTTEDIRNDPRYDELLQKMNLPPRKALLTSSQ
jgi:TolB-like protein/AraC-like DNA-binding protein/Tfp pilus assembly protein PilF